MKNILPNRNVQRKEKDDEKTKLDIRKALEAEMNAKIELSKLLTRRRKMLQRLNALTEQTRIQRRIIADVCQELETAGHDARRLSKLLPVLEKIEIVLTQETAKI